MKKNVSILFTGLMVLLLCTGAWADELDPRANFGTCGFTSTEETYEPDAGGTLVKRVTYVSECDTPAAGDETITITTEEWNGSALEVTEVREALRTTDLGRYYTTTMVYDGSMALLSKVEHTYDWRTLDPDIWFQDWIFYNWNGSDFVVTGYTTRSNEWLGLEETEVTYVYYDTVLRPDPVIPDDVPVLGSNTSYSILPPLDKGIDLGHYANLGRMYERVRNVMIVNPNTQSEGNVILRDSGDPVSHLCVPPPNVYVHAVLKGDRWDDPGLFYNGYFHRWVKWLNTDTGDLDVLFGWTSDRDLNEPTSDWWQARVRQSPDGSIEAIENAHRSGLTEEDHYDTYTTLNGMFMIESQVVKMFDYDEGNPGNFTQLTTVTDGMAAPVYYEAWTVVFD